MVNFGVRFQPSVLRIRRGFFARPPSHFRVRDRVQSIECGGGAPPARRCLHHGDMAIGQRAHDICETLGSCVGAHDARELIGGHRSGLECRLAAEMARERTHSTTDAALPATKYHIAAVDDKP